jgi:hypothetical protein
MVIMIWVTIREDRRYLKKAIGPEKASSFFRKDGEDFVNFMFKLEREIKPAKERPSNVYYRIKFDFGSVLLSSISEFWIRGAATVAGGLILDWIKNRRKSAKINEVEIDFKITVRDGKRRIKTWPLEGSFPEKLLEKTWREVIETIKEIEQKKFKRKAYKTLEEY